MKKLDNNSFIKKTSIEGLYLIEKPTFEDSRGFFREVIRINELKKEAGIDFSPKQWSHSKSNPGVLRGFHAEPWNKLAYPASGKVFVAIADIRPDSDTFGKCETFIIDTAESLKALFISEGLANSYCVVGKKPVTYLYLQDEYYQGSNKRSVIWNDPDLNVKWPIKNPIVSEVDQENLTLRELFPEKFKSK